MEIPLASLNLSNFPGRLDELLEIFGHAFKGDHNNATHHFEWFMTLALKYGIKEEDIYMRSFVLHLGGKALTWFVGLDKGMISSFAKLVETFCNRWDSGSRDKWIPHVKHVKDLFSKESQSKDQVKATIVQGLTDDILSTID